MNKKLTDFVKILRPVLTSADGSIGEQPITGVSNNSKLVKPGEIFCAIRGAKADGHQYLPDAVQHGASAFVIAIDSDWQAPDPAVPVFRVSDSYYAWALLCETLYEKPADSMNVYAVTGTNGKTTTSYLLRKIFRAAFPKERCGLLSTVEYDTGKGQPEEAFRTTPDALQFQQLFDNMRKNGCSRAVMELSSHGLHQHRTGSLHLAGGIFTNLTGDHLDYHGDMEHYFQAKSIMFTELLQQGAPAVLNLDDPYGRRLHDMLKNRQQVYGFTLKGEAGAAAVVTQMKLTPSGAEFTLSFHGEKLRIKSALAGEYNVSNITGCAVLALSLGVPSALLVKILAEPDAAPPGRLEKIELPDDVVAFVDYAHSDDALYRVLGALRRIASKRIITVFGCGGDRDKTKRPRMAAAAEKLSDCVIVTSDNPRTEEPVAIIEDIRKGFSGGYSYQVEPDRAKAIQLAVEMAKPGDIILVAGKGHENYQEINGVKHHFDDREILRKYRDSGK